jgi:hypothetical protein
VARPEHLDPTAGSWCDQAVLLVLKLRAPPLERPGLRPREPEREARSVRSSLRAFWRCAHLEAPCDDVTVTDGVRPRRGLLLWWLAAG